MVFFPTSPIVITDLVNRKPPAAAKFFCAVCDNGFKFQNGFSQHNEDKHKEPPPSSQSIGKQKRTREEFEVSTGCLPEVPIKHKRKRTGTLETPVKKEFEPAEVLGNDTVTTSPWTGCAKVFRSEGCLDSHLLAKHPSLLATVGPPAMLPASIVNVLSCTFCKKILKSNHLAKRHGRRHDRHIKIVAAFRCIVCSDTFLDKCQVAVHSVEQNNVSPAILEPKTLEAATLEAPLNDKMTCVPCKRVFTTEQGLKQHNKDKHPASHTSLETIHPNLLLRGKILSALQKSISMNQTPLAPNKIKQEPVDDNTIESYSEPSSGQQHWTKSGSDDDSEDDSEDDPKVHPELQVHLEVHPWDYSDDSEDDSEDGSEDDLEDVPEDDSEDVPEDHPKVHPELQDDLEDVPEDDSEDVPEDHPKVHPELQVHLEDHPWDYSDDSEDGSEDDPEVNPDDDPEDDSAGELEDGSECESEDDSECESEDGSECESEDDSEDESVDESEDDMEQDVEDDASESEEDDGSPKWPEYGQVARIPCLYRHVGCGKVFSAASMLMQHHELHSCPVDILWFDSDIFDDSAWSRKVYDDINDNYKCPYCKSKDGGRFDFLFQLLHHAESNECNLRVRTGPIKEIRSKLLEFADNVR
ncbi:hypothetical protein FSST1_003038 [Fusarium sambucinum]